MLCANRLRRFCEDLRISPTTRLWFCDFFTKSVTGITWNIQLSLRPIEFPGASTSF
jgi:hypothetical protein